MLVSIAMQVHTFFYSLLLDTGRKIKVKGLEIGEVMSSNIGGGGDFWGFPSSLQWKFPS